MEESQVFEVKSKEETIQLACRLAEFLSPGSVITLEGELGAGKTVFTQGLAKGLDIKQIVNSPTFTLIKEYQGKYPLYHMDVYRLEGDAQDLGFEEYFFGHGVTVIEWASIIQDYLPDDYLNIKIEKVDKEKRRIIFLPKGDTYINLCEEFVKNENNCN